MKKHLESALLIPCLAIGICLIPIAVGIASRDFCKSMRDGIRGSFGI